jgi:hypothetical protein
MFLAIMAVAFFKRKEMPSDGWAAVGRILAPVLCFLPIFIFMPRLSEYYYLAVLPFLYYTAVYLKSGLGRPVTVLIVVFIALNLLGLGYYWSRYNDYNYNNYAARIRAVLPAPDGFAVLGNMSLFPGLSDYPFYALENASLAPPTDTQTYAGFARRIKELNIQYIIYQESNYKQPFHASYLAGYLHDKCRLSARVFDPGYGSEGQKRNNYINIFKVIK